jgi:hypothetical protein
MHGPGEEIDAVKPASERDSVNGKANETHLVII